MNSDYDRWFICTDGSAIKCKRERFSDFLKDLLGAEKQRRRTLYIGRQPSQRIVD